MGRRIPTQARFLCFDLALTIASTPIDERSRRAANPRKDKADSQIAFCLESVHQCFHINTSFYYLFMNKTKF